jgi:hypothetical protein
MRASILIGAMAISLVGGPPAAWAQVSNSPLFEPSPGAAPPSWPAWQGMQDGRAVLAPQYIPAPRYPTDSRNLTLDNRAPTLWPAGPDLRDAVPRNGALGTGVRRSDGLQVPAEPGRPSWR